MTIQNVKPGDTALFEGRVVDVGREANKLGRAGVSDGAPYYRISDAVTGEYLGIVSHILLRLAPEDGSDQAEFTLAEAADQLGLSHSTLRWAVHNDAIRAVKRGREWRVTQDAIEEYREMSLGKPGRPSGAAG